MFGENAAPTPHNSKTERQRRVAKRRPNLQTKKKKHLFCVKGCRLNLHIQHICIVYHSLFVCHLWGYFCSRFPFRGLSIDPSVYASKCVLGTENVILSSLLVNLSVLYVYPCYFYFFDRVLHYFPFWFPSWFQSFLFRLSKETSPLAGYITKSYT